jgi:hypothetical protein
VSRGGSDGLRWHLKPNFSVTGGSLIGSLAHIVLIHVVTLESSGGGEKQLFGRWKFPRRVAGPNSCILATL